MGLVTRMPTRISAGTLIVMCLSAGTLQADIGIKPAFVEVNLDEGRLVGKYEILDDAGTTISSGPFGSAYVLRDTQRWLTKKLDAGNPGGSCTVRVSFQAAHLGQPLTKEAQVTWPEVPPAEIAKTESDSAVQPASEEPQGQSENPTDGRQIDGGAGK